LIEVVCPSKDSHPSKYLSWQLGIEGMPMAAFMPALQMPNV